YISASSHLSTLSLHDALPILDAMVPSGRMNTQSSGMSVFFIHMATRSAVGQMKSIPRPGGSPVRPMRPMACTELPPDRGMLFIRSEEHTSELQSRENIVCRLL